MGMRKFIISDIHGNGDIYDTIMGYLDNISANEDVELFINGDLTDRGIDSFRVLMDVLERIKGKGNVKINYLGGNHELMMYEALNMIQKRGWIDFWSDWINNGGYFIEGELDAREDGLELAFELRDFVGELKIYHVFDEKIKNNNLLLVHAQAPFEVLEGKDLKIKDDNSSVFNAVWTRRERREPSFFVPGKVIGYNRIGLDNFYTIIGHTPVKKVDGFEINEDEKYINIDGGCASYAVGMFEYQYVPLLEVYDGHIDIIVFNHNNEITNGYHYDGELIKMTDDELESRKEYINHEYDDQAKVYKKNILDICDNI